MRGGGVCTQANYQWVTRLVSLILVHWTVIYPVDSAIKLTNNRRTLICVYLEVVKVITSLRGWQFVWREGEKVMKTRAKIARIRAAKVSRFFAPLSPRGSFAQRVTRREGMVGNLMPRSPKCAAVKSNKPF